MTGIKLFQCIPAYKPEATARLIRTLFALDCKILLDIEDSIQDVVNPELTPSLKQNARLDLQEIIGCFPSGKFSLRINSVRSSEFEQDIELLANLSGRIESIFIPKIESINDIDVFYSATSQKYKLNLIIETRNGVENLDGILNSEFKDRIDYIFFGNYDYHLDIGNYPITEQYSLEYWKLVQPIIRKAENHQLKFGNSPYANIADKSTLDFSVMQLTKLCKSEFALMSLHKEQTLHLKKLIDGLQFSLTREKLQQENNFPLAEFTQHKQKGRSFSFNGKRIITPQEYFLAIKKQDG